MMTGGARERALHANPVGCAFMRTMREEKELN